MMKMQFIISFAVLMLTTTACQRTAVDAAKPPQTAQKTAYPPDKFVIGSDLSFVNQLEDYGAVYRDSGKVKDCFKLFKERGNNLVRVRIWHTPTWLAALNKGKFYSDLPDVTKTMRRAKAEGMHVNLVIHYTDTWADPALPTLWAAFD